jgi:uncharacterized protein (TIGR00661 family)
MIINFYDMIGSLAGIFAGAGTVRVSISHHFFFGHPDFTWPDERKGERALLLLHSRIAALRAHKKLALSFTPAPDDPERKLYIIPPLLRNRIVHARPADLGFILIYTLYPGYFRQIEDWCLQHPDSRLRMFSRFTKVPAIRAGNLELNPIDETKFIDALTSCSMVSCTAGFETLAEAAFLGKILEAVPTGNHFEQLCNALDMERAGLGYRKMSLIPLHVTGSSGASHNNHDAFRSWVLKAEGLILMHLGL